MAQQIQKLAEWAEDQSYITRSKSIYPDITATSIDLGDEISMGAMAHYSTIRSPNCRSDYIANIRRDTTGDTIDVYSFRQIASGFQCKTSEGGGWIDLSTESGVSVVKLYNQASFENIHDFTDIAEVNEPILLGDQDRNYPALDFDGSNHYMECPDHIDWSFVSESAVTDVPFFIDARLNPDDVTSARIMGKRSSSGDFEYLISVGGPGDLARIDLYDNSSSHRIAENFPATTSLEGSWSHLTWGYTGLATNSSDEAFEMHYSGVPQTPDSTSNAGTYVAKHNLASKVYLGSFMEGGGQYYDGKLSKISVFNDMRVTVRQAKYLKDYYDAL